MFMAAVVRWQIVRYYADEGARWVGAREAHKVLNEYTEVTQ